jgi:hypothetical protein
MELNLPPAPCMWRLERRSCYGSAMDGHDSNGPLAGVSEEERRIMERLLRMRPEPHKAAPKPAGAQADAQRRRREKEREGQHPSEASGGA